MLIFFFFKWQLCELRIVLNRGYTCAMIVHTQADKVLPQLLMDYLILHLHITGTFDICMNKFDAEKLNFDKMAVL